MDLGSARSAIQTTLAALEEAWAHGDGPSWAERCTHDVDFINLLGMYVKGRAAVMQIHEKIFRGPYAGSTLTFKVEHIRLLSGDHVIAIVPGELQIPTGPVQGVVRTMATILFARTGDQWLVASFQNTKREATAADHTSVMVNAVTS